MISALAAENNTTAAYYGFNLTADSVAGGPVFPSYIRTTSMIFCIVILGIGVVGNVMVPIVILKSKDMRNSTNIFLMNLSVADLMVLLVCTPTVLVEVNSPPEVWVLGEEMCKAVPFVELTVAHASVLTILAISFERYYAICEPLKAGYVCTKARAFLICVLAWVFAAVFTSPILAVAEYSFEEYFDGTTVPVCFTRADDFWPVCFFISTISLFFIIPLAILVVLYSIIARSLTANPALAKSMSSHRGCNGHILRYRRQVVLMLGTVVLSFFLCLLPFRALTLWIIIAPPEAMASLGVEGYYNLLYFCRIMLYLNSAVNPILYNLMSSKFRDGFARLCGVKRGLRRRATRTSGTGDSLLIGRNGTSSGSTQRTSSSSESAASWRRNHSVCAASVRSKQQSFLIRQASSNAADAKAKGESYV
ncbi:thyrotropin-releasing hormone receptor-like isoform X2 [Neocloeon triangulifer]|uniref:thyrotropin-releasing hormone receptor-like isoform X2 n=1 Tax=Neocloeon triangulifer TaxID=2078957 RepID=UPI00286ED864|nr:thyrotropin-releasing hormone receptor-like isoform X2 [Neocloeon triangulifer]